MSTKLSVQASNDPTAQKDLKLADEFATEGLRVLAFGMRKMENADEIANIEQATASSIETDLELLGITAVEDLLQEDVSSCIRDFRTAGIKVWMLTGDKGETALEIGLRCGLYDLQQMRVIKIVESTDVEVLSQDLNTHLASLNIMVDNDDIEHDKSFDRFALAVAGRSLPVIYESEMLSNLINKLFAKSEAVIVFRSSPAQKAETVRYISKNLDTKKLASLTTVAIGDGANDVNMIQSAHIGIGIYGKEGNQAASFADYALP